MRNFNKFLETRMVVMERERESLNYVEEIIRIFHWCAGIHNKLKKREIAINRGKRTEKRFLLINSGTVRIYLAASLRALMIRPEIN